MSDKLADEYRNQIRLQMHEEANRRLQEVIDPREDARVLALSLVELVKESLIDIIQNESMSNIYIGLKS